MNAMLNERLVEASIVACKMCRAAKSVECGDGRCSLDKWSAAAEDYVVSGEEFT